MEQHSYSKKTLESTVVRDIITMLQKDYGGYILKVHGDMYQKAGVPDILWWYKGIPFAFEVKRPMGSYKLTPLQELNLTQMQKAGVYAFMVRTPAEVKEFVNKILNRKG